MTNNSDFYVSISHRLSVQVDLDLIVDMCKYDFVGLVENNGSASNFFDRAPQTTTASPMLASQAMHWFDGVEKGYL